MPATQITPIVSTYAGKIETRQQVDVTNGMYLPANDGKYLVRFEDTDAAVDGTVTVVAQAKYGGLVLTNPTISVIHDATYLKAMYAGPFDPAIFNDGGSNVQFTFAAYAGTGSKYVVSAIHLG